MLKNRLNSLRKACGKSQQDVATALSVSRQVFNNYELGKREPDYGMVIRLAEYFNVTTDYLLGKSDNPAPYDKTKNEPTPRDELTQKIFDLLDNVPDEKLDKVKALLLTAIDTVT